MLINMPTKELYHIKHSLDERPSRLDFSIHAHSHYELLIFLSGDITYQVEGNFYRPKPFDILIFDIAETHKVLVNSDVPYERLVIQMDKRLFSDIAISEAIFSPFTKRLLGENNLLSEHNFTDDLWKKCILRFIKTSPTEKTDVMALLMPLLNEIRHAFSFTEAERKPTPLSLQIMLYINEHIKEDITPLSISEHFYISRTALYSLFRSSTGTGIHNYINVKRLILAQDLLHQGEKPTRVYEKIGFKDYTSFFRAYKKLFGISPSSKKSV